MPDAQSADVIVLIEDGDTGLVVEASAADVEPLDTIDATRRFARVRADGGEALAGSPQGAMDRIAVAVAAELVGVAQRTMEMAVDYARERKQFGRPIGSYQAVSHQCAEMLPRSRALAPTYWAAWCADSEPGRCRWRPRWPRPTPPTPAGPSRRRRCKVHGGIGFTWEHDLHFFLKRAKADGQLYGTARGTASESRS